VRALAMAIAGKAARRAQKSAWNVLMYLCRKAIHLRENRERKDANEAIVAAVAKVRVCSPAIVMNRDVTAAETRSASSDAKSCLLKTMQCLQQMVQCLVMRKPVARSAAVAIAAHATTISVVVAPVLMKQVPCRQ